MVFGNQRVVLRSLGRSVLSMALVSASLPVFAARGLAFPQSEQDRSFAEALQDYNNNLFPSAQAKFEKVKGARAQEAKQYVDKIKAYNDAMNTANDIMRRSRDELDVKSVESAIQEYEKAIKVKSDGPKMPTRKLESAKDMQRLIERDLKQAANDLCDKVLAAAREHRYGDAADYACRLDATYSCGGDKASELCEKYKKPQAPQRSAADNADIFDEGMTAYEGNDFKGARSLFAMVSTDPAAKEYLDKMSRFQNYMTQAKQLGKDSKYEEARVAFAGAANIKSNGPGNPRAGVLQMELAEGLDKFYSGDYLPAIQNLDEYARSGGEKQPLAHFYLGASKLGRFFLTGGEDAGLQQDALKDLKDAKQAGFKAESLDVSPKIQQIYHDLVFQPTR